MVGLLRSFIIQVGGPTLHVGNILKEQVHTTITYNTSSTSSTIYMTLRYVAQEICIYKHISAPKICQKFCHCFALPLLLPLLLRTQQHTNTKNYIKLLANFHQAIYSKLWYTVYPTLQTLEFTQVDTLIIRARHSI